MNPAKPDLKRLRPSLRRAAGALVQFRPSGPLPCWRLMLSASLTTLVSHVRHAVDWNDPAREKLWLYNLHYFDDLNAVAAAKRTAWHRALLARWVAENPPGVR
jgi:hypothetical protein